MAMKRVGVLALQGAVQPHFAHLRAAGVEPVEVRTREELASVDGLIIPGGESSTMLKLLNILGLKQSLRDFAASKPMWGMCAGSILMAREVSHPAQESFGFMDLAIERNAFGRQLDSFTTEIAGMKDVAFIRAPRIRAFGAGVRILAQFEGEAVWVEEGRHMASTCHPELSLQTPSPFHRHFVEKLS
jgi:5'-phosphate synthase pdxT subunit